METEHDRDAVNRRLAEIQDLLIELPSDDFAARYQLLLERDGLRARVRDASDPDALRSSEDLRAELRTRKAALEEVKLGMVNTAGMAGGGGAETGSYEGPLDGMKINNAIREARGTDELVRRITHLEGILQERGEL